MAKQITIPVPCHEDWNEMTVNEQGRHCTRCEKTVVDFTQKKAQEILFFLNENSAGKVCGRFTTAQLEAPIPTPEDFVRQISWFRMPLIKKVAAIFLFSFSVFAVSCNDSNERITGDLIPVSLVDSPPHFIGDTVLTPPPMGAPVPNTPGKSAKVKPVCTTIASGTVSGEMVVIDSYPGVNPVEVAELPVTDSMMPDPEPFVMGKIAPPQGKPEKPKNN